MTEEDSRDGVHELVDLWSAAAQAYMDGDLPTYARLARHGEDYTLMPPRPLAPALFAAIARGEHTASQP